MKITTADPMALAAALRRLQDNIDLMNRSGELSDAAYEKLDAVISDARILAGDLPSLLQSAAYANVEVSVTHDGEKWRVYAPKIQDGITGFGDSPTDAFIAFDKEMYTPNYLRTSAAPGAAT